MSEDKVETICSLMDEVWATASKVRFRLGTDFDILKMRSSASELKDLLLEYENSKNDQLDESTLWLGWQMVEAVEDISNGYIKLHSIS